MSRSFKPLSKERPINFLIIGMGSIGVRHGSILKKMGHTLWAYRTLRSTYPHPLPIDATFFHLEEALSKKPDGILITNPNDLHLETAFKTLPYKIPLFIEKPLSHSLEKIDLFQKSAEGIPLLVGFNLRYHPAFLLFETLLEKVGQPLYLSAHFGSYLPSWHPWEDYKKSFSSSKTRGGGVSLVSCHEIDLALALLGEVSFQTSLTSGIGSLDIEAEEGRDLLLKHHKGATSHLHLNFYQKNYDRFLKLVGTKGTLMWNFLSSALLFDGPYQKEYPLGSDATTLLQISYQNQMMHFIEVVKGEKEPKVDLKAGIDCLKIALHSYDPKAHSLQRQIQP